MYNDCCTLNLEFSWRLTWYLFRKLRSVLSSRTSVDTLTWTYGFNSATREWTASTLREREKITTESRIRHLCRVLTLLRVDIWTGYIYIKSQFSYFLLEIQSKKGIEFSLFVTKVTLVYLFFWLSTSSSLMKKLVPRSQTSHRLLSWRVTAYKHTWANLITQS